MWFDVMMWTNKMFISNLINIRLKILILEPQTLFFKIIIFFIFHE